MAGGGTAWESYFYPETYDPATRDGVLMNRADLRQEQALHSFEYRMVAMRQIQLRQHPEWIERTWDAAHLRRIHHWLFQDVYQWAGQYRRVGIRKHVTDFAEVTPGPDDIDHYLAEMHRIITTTPWADLNRDEFAEAAAKTYAWLNQAHPFREGNGRTGKVFMAQVAEQSRFTLELRRIAPEVWNQASALTGPDIGTHDPVPDTLVPVLRAAAQPRPPEVGQDRHIEPAAPQIQDEPGLQEPAPDRRDVPDDRDRPADPDPETTVVAVDYQIQHRAPGDDGYSHPITEARQAFGPDILEAPDLYGSSDEQTMTQLRAALEGADTVRIYRAVPQGVTAINDGDWVTLSREYAHDHGWNEDPAQVMPVVAADVPVTSVYTDGNDPSEWGYAGPRIEALIPMGEGETEVAGRPGGSATVTVEIDPGTGDRVAGVEPDLRWRDGMDSRTAVLEARGIYDRAPVEEPPRPEEPSARYSDQDRTLSAEQSGRARRAQPSPEPQQRGRQAGRDYGARQPAGHPEQDLRRDETRNPPRSARERSLDRQYRKDREARDL